MNDARAGRRLGAGSAWTLDFWPWEQVANVSGRSEGMLLDLDSTTRAWVVRPMLTPRPKRGRRRTEPTG